MWWHKPRHTASSHFRPIRCPRYINDNEFNMFKSINQNKQKLASYLYVFISILFIQNRFIVRSVYATVIPLNDASSTNTSAANQHIDDETRTTDTQTHWLYNILNRNTYYQGWRFHCQPNGVYSFCCRSFADIFLVFKLCVFCCVLLKFWFVGWRFC